MKEKESKKVDPYPTWQEAATAARSMGIQTALGYRFNYHRDPRLRSNLSKTYKDFPGFKTFIGDTHNHHGSAKTDFYNTWQDAVVAALKLRINTNRDWSRLYHRDPRLPSRPDHQYRDQGFPGFPLSKINLLSDLV